MALLRNIATVSGFTLISRVLGFVRDVIMARVLGAGDAADAFVVSFKLANFFRRLFAEGAFNAAFVPLFTEKLQGEGGRAAARKFAGEALSMLTAALVLLVILFQIAMPWVLLVFAGGYADEPEKYDLAVQLTRITFPYILFISLVSLLGSILNSLGKFAVTAATPILLNMTLIAAMLLADATMGMPALSLAIGVSVAGVLQFLWVLAACIRIGMLPRLKLPRLTPDVRRLLILMAPVAVGAGAAQLNLLVDTMLASFLKPGSQAFLYYADRLNQLPLGVIGVAVGTALLPLLSRQISAADDAGAQDSQNRAVEFGLLLTLPAAVALMIVPAFLIQVLFERGAFDAEATRQTAYALTAYASGLPAYVLIKILGPGFYARQDTATPVKIAIAALVLNVVLNLILMGPLAHAGLALATALAAWLNAGLMGLILIRRGLWRPDAQLISRMARLVLACGLFAAALFYGAGPLVGLFGEPTGQQILPLTALVAGGVLLFILLAFGLRIVSLTQLRGYVTRRSDIPPEVT